MTDWQPIAREALAPEGVLRAAINLGNPVLAQGTVDAPAGVTVDIARAVAERLGVALEMRVFEAARESFAALVAGEVALGFMAIEPVRADQVSFTEPYVHIEGVYAVPKASPLRTVASVDAAGVRVGVEKGSAYDLFLTRTLTHAEIVRGSEGSGGFEIFREQGLEAGAGIRQPALEFIAAHPEFRLIDEAFMQIRQAVAVDRQAPDELVSWLNALLEELKASGAVRHSFDASGHPGVTIPTAA